MRDEAGFLQNAHRHRHARPPYSQHLGQEFLRKVELVAPDPVLRHQQPARGPLVDDMESVARRRLRDSLEHELAVAMQQPVETFELPGQLKEIIRGDAPRLA